MLLATLWPMKRPVLTAVFLVAVAGLAGCPIYDHEGDGCDRDSDCGRDYICDQPSGDCILGSNIGCRAPSDCDMTSTCTPAGVCMTGDCSFYHGCVAGYRCDSSSGVWACVPGTAGAAGSSSQAGGAAGEPSTVAQGGGGAAGQADQNPALAG